MTRSYRALAIALLATLALATSSTAATAKTKSTVGTLQKVDGQTLTIQTATGNETVTLAPAAHISSHAKALSTADLSSHVGQRVKVHYTESNGQKQASAVTVESTPVKTSSAAGHSGKKGAKS